MRLELVEEAKKLSRLETDVVAITPFIVEVIIPAFARIVLVLMIDEVDVIPFTLEVSVFTAEFSAF